MLSRMRDQLGLVERLANNYGQADEQHLKTLKQPSALLFQASNLLAKEP